jgi:hypothetical protein
MSRPVTREEFDTLADEVEGEKLVTRHILEQTRRNGDDLAALKTRVTRVEEKVDGVARQLGGLERKVDGLVRDLPKIVGDSVREALNERPKRR